MDPVRTIPDSNHRGTTPDGLRVCERPWGTSPGQTDVGRRPGCRCDDPGPTHVGVETSVAGPTLYPPSRLHIWGVGTREGGPEIQVPCSGRSTAPTLTPVSPLFLPLVVSGSGASTLTPTVFSYSDPMDWEKLPRFQSGEGLKVGREAGRGDRTCPRDSGDGSGWVDGERRRGRRSARIGTRRSRTCGRVSPGSEG